MIAAALGFCLAFFPAALAEVAPLAPCVRHAQRCHALGELCARERAARPYAQAWASEACVEARDCWEERCQ